LRDRYAHTRYAGTSRRSPKHSKRGGGLLTAIEVLEVEDDLAAISDNEVKEGSKTSRAARKVLRSIGELPKSLVDDLRSVLNARQEVGKESLSARRTRNLPQC